MRILDLEFKNFASYGNTVQKLKFEKDHNDLILLSGVNGSGKCLSGDTEVEIEIEDEYLYNKFVNFITK